MNRRNHAGGTQRVDIVNRCRKGGYIYAYRSGTLMQRRLPMLIESEVSGLGAQGSRMRTCSAMSGARARTCNTEVQTRHWWKYKLDTQRHSTMGRSAPQSLYFRRSRAIVGKITIQSLHASSVINTGPTTWLCGTTRESWQRWKLGYMARRPEDRHGRSNRYVNTKQSLKNNQIGH